MPCVVDYELCRLLAFPNQNDTSEAHDPMSGSDRVSIILACVGVLAMWTGVALWV